MRIMVAPNCARLTQNTHPAVPITISETVACAAECFAAGADALHAHVRDENGEHSLDAGLCRELLDEMRRAVPRMKAQISSGLAGRYSPDDQRDLIHDLEPPMASVALREQLSDNDAPAARTMYFDAQAKGVEIQHILYAPSEVTQLERLQDGGVIPKGKPSVLFVLGRGDDGQPPAPRVIDHFLAAATRPLDWMVAAFGKTETECLVAATILGGAARIGFENNQLNVDGHIAAKNADRVGELWRALECDRLAGSPVAANSNK